MSGRVVLRITCVLGLALGLGCLNYTNGIGFEHHTEVARENGWPEPSYTIFVVGAALAVVSAFSLGMSLGRGRRQTS